MDAISVLKQNGIQVEENYPGRPGCFILDDEFNIRLRLRELGFRLGQGTETVSGILYFKGRFCGYLVEKEHQIS